jgi:hypothetical protein
MIYLQQSPYMIKGTVVEEFEVEETEPVLFADFIDHFENGQVLNVLIKD